MVPYVQVLPEVADALEPYVADFRYLPRDDSYCKLLAELWSQREAFLLVEHDIVPFAGALEELWACGQEWCAFPYRYMGGHYPGLGCVKFSGDLQRRTPRAMAEVLGMQDSDHPAGHWCRLDGWLRIRLEAAGVRQHVHQPEVLHLSDGWPAHGCVKVSA